MDSEELKTDLISSWWRRRRLTAGSGGGGCGLWGLVHLLLGAGVQLVVGLVVAVGHDLIVGLQGAHPSPVHLGGFNGLSWWEGGRRGGELSKKRGSSVDDSFESTNTDTEYIIC